MKNSTLPLSIAQPNDQSSLISIPWGMRLQRFLALAYCRNTRAIFSCSRNFHNMVMLGWIVSILKHRFSQLNCYSSKRQLPFSDKKKVSLNESLLCPSLSYIFTRKHRKRARSNKARRYLFCQKVAGLLLKQGGGLILFSELKRKHLTRRSKKNKKITITNHHRRNICSRPKIQSFKE